jgi:hypothetical protein
MPDPTLVRPRIFIACAHIMSMTVIEHSAIPAGAVAVVGSPIDIPWRFVRQHDAKRVLVRPPIVI